MGCCPQSKPVDLKVFTTFCHSAGMQSLWCIQPRLLPCFSLGLYKLCRSMAPRRVRSRYPPIAQGEGSTNVHPKNG